MANQKGETTSIGHFYNRCVDAVNNLFDTMSFWTHSKDVEFVDGKNAETKVGAINGITSDISGEADDIAASIKCVNELNSSLIKHKLIWTNPNTSAFAAQTINIDVSPYDAIYIDFLPSTDDGSVQRAVPNQIIGKGGTVYISYSTTKSGGFPWVTTRSITVSDNSIVFSDCTQQQNNGSNYSNVNYRIVPYKIYGIKF